MQPSNLKAQTICSPNRVHERTTGSWEVFILLGGDLTAGVVFSSLAMFDLIQVPINLRLACVGEMVEAIKVMLARTGRLLSSCFKAHVDCPHSGSSEFSEDCLPPCR